MYKVLTLKLSGLAIILLLSISGIQAQDSSSDASYNSEGRFGIRVGGIISKQNFEDGSPIEDPASKFGLDLAILYTMPIGDGFLALQPELHWMQKGSTIEAIDINGNPSDYTTTMNYLELPLLLRVNFGGSLKLFAFGGPSAGFLLSVNSDDDFLKKEDFEDIEFGVHLGAGIGLGSFEIDVRYMAGLSDISAADGNASDIKNSSFGAGLTLKF